MDTSGQFRDFAQECDRLAQEVAKTEQQRNVLKEPHQHAMRRTRSLGCCAHAVSGAVMLLAQAPVSSSSSISIIIIVIIIIISILIFVPQRSRPGDCNLPLRCAAGSGSFANCRLTGGG
jgi:hypothetical protein